MATWLEPATSLRPSAITGRIKPRILKLFQYYNFCLSKINTLFCTPLDVLWIYYFWTINSYLILKSQALQWLKTDRWFTPAHVLCYNIMHGSKYPSPDFSPVHLNRLVLLQERSLFYKLWPAVWEGSFYRRAQSWIRLQSEVQRRRCSCLLV